MATVHYDMAQGRVTVESRLILDNPVTAEVDTPASHRDQSAWTVAHHVILCYIVDMPGSHRGYIGMFRGYNGMFRGHPAYKARLHCGYTGNMGPQIIFDKKIEISHDSPWLPTNYSPGDTGVKIGTVGL